MGKFFKECVCCGQNRNLDCFLKTRNSFFQDNLLPICHYCVEDQLKTSKGDFNLVDKLCRLADIPFMVDEWVKLYKDNGERTFSLYGQMFAAGQYSGIDWTEVNNKYNKLLEKNMLEAAVPEIEEEKWDSLRDKWGPYLPEELLYLENLYQGILKSHNVVGEIQLDNAKKLCRISLIIDNKIRGGEEFKDELASYDKLVKIADFTPKNIKNMDDFNSVGEVFAFLERRGWINKFYDGAEKDIVDSTMKNIQLYNRNLYVNETGIAEDIERRIEGLKIAEQLEGDMDLPIDDLDQYEVDGYELTEDFEEEI